MKRMSTSIRELDAATVNRLTRREYEVMILVALTGRSKEIATQLGIAKGTVDKHVENALHKLGVPKRIEAARAVLAYDIRRKAVEGRPADSIPMAAPSSMTPSAAANGGTNDGQAKHLAFDHGERSGTPFHAAGGDAGRAGGDPLRDGRAAQNAVRDTSGDDAGDHSALADARADRRSAARLGLADSATPGTRAYAVKEAMLITGLTIIIGLVLGGSVALMNNTQLSLQQYDRANPAVSRPVGSHP